MDIGVTPNRLSEFEPQVVKNVKKIFLGLAEIYWHVCKGTKNKVNF
jgi:hypothetical protein